MEGGPKPENQDKNPESENKNQHHSQSTYTAESGIRTRATFLGDELYFLETDRF